MSEAGVRPRPGVCAPKPKFAFILQMQCAAYCASAQWAGMGISEAVEPVGFSRSHAARSRSMNMPVERVR